MDVVDEAVSSYITLNEQYQDEKSYCLVGGADPE